jgi:hypothetical protein
MGPFCVPWTITPPAERLIFGNVILPEAEEGVCNAVYIDDLVDGLILAALSSAAAGERFIMSGPTPVTWATFFTVIACALGTKPPQFWSRDRIEKQKEQIEKAAQKIDPKPPIRLVLNPKRLLKILVSWKPARKIMEASYDALSDPLQKIVRSYYTGSGSGSSYTRGEIFLPDPIYSSKATAGSEKARLKLGHRPRFNFQRGIEVTAGYLQLVCRDDLRGPQALQDGA